MSILKKIGYDFSEIKHENEKAMEIYSEFSANYDILMNHLGQNCITKEVETPRGIEIFPEFGSEISCIQEKFYKIGNLEKAMVISSAPEFIELNLRENRILVVYKNPQ